jgi:hypothetical protein
MTHKPIKDPDEVNQVEVSQVDVNQVEVKLNELNELNQTNQIDEVNQPYQSSSGFKSTKKKVYLAIGLILMFSTVSLGQLLVHDPKHMIQNVIEFGKNLKELNRHQAYRELMDGGWKSPMKILKLSKITLASLGVDTSKLGWDTDNFRDEKAVKVASQGIDQLNKILKGEAPGSQDLSQVIQEVYGDIPVTRRGAPVRMAYESVTGTITQTGDNQNAIKEVLKNSDDIQAKYEAGGLTNGDRERIKGMEQNLQLRVQALNAQAMNQNNLLLAQSLAMQAGQEARQERERLSQRQQMFRAMGAINVGLGSTKNKGEE